MENFKIEHFNRDNPGGQFPRYRSLNPSEAQVICRNLASMLGMEADTELMTIVLAIDDRAEQLGNTNADDSGFSIIEILHNLGIKHSGDVYVNWYRYDEIDEMALSGLNQYFDYIWYPGSDDIEIFDSTFNWVLAISHDGNIKFIRLPI
ncbi:MAG: hypothetical protein HQK56_15095 [Deltaproteobacteria bacterium]|nr:hypothetical protein [Deltaproteobacteria bacterium]